MGECAVLEIIGSGRSVSDECSRIFVGTAGCAVTDIEFPDRDGFAGGKWRELRFETTQ